MNNLDKINSKHKISQNKTKQMSLAEKYRLLIQEVEGLYREFLFDDLPIYNTQKINLLEGLTATGISEATYIINYLNKTRNIDGDICEFGIAQGATSALIANEIITTKKRLWLFDSFAGLSKPSNHDDLKDDIFNLGSIEEYEGTMAYSVNEVQERLLKINFPMDRVNIIPGFIEDTLQESNFPKKVSFAYIDLDFYKPTYIALEFLDKVIESDGIIIVDDFNFFSTGVKKAVDEFMALNSNNYHFFLPVKPAGFFCVLRKLNA